MTLSFAPEAARVVAEAADFYAQARPGLDVEFLAAVRSTFRRILERPTGGMRVDEVVTRISSGHRRYTPALTVADHLATD